MGGDARANYTGGIVGAVGDMYSEYLSEYNMAIGAGNDFGMYRCFSTAIINDTSSTYRTGGLVGWSNCDYLTDVYQNCRVGGSIESGSYSTAGLIGDCWSTVNGQFPSRSHSTVLCLNFRTCSAPSQSRILILRILPDYSSAISMHPRTSHGYRVLPSNQALSLL